LSDKFSSYVILNDAVDDTPTVPTPINENVFGDPVETNSLLKYGPEKHIFEIIEECSLEQLNEQKEELRNDWDSNNVYFEISKVEYDMPIELTLEEPIEEEEQQIEPIIDDKIKVIEIKEIVSYFLNAESNILEVTFRTIADSDEVLRVDNIDYSISEEYGYVLESEDFGFYDDEFDDEEDYYEDPKIELDEEVLISFLNEYYEVNPKSLPKPEYY
jgi:hypothetical protein